MKDSKWMKILEVAGSGSLLISKYLLAVGSIFGWIAAIVGYALTGVYNFKRDIRIIAVVVIGLLLLSAYGWYKWECHVKGLQTFDYTVILLTTCAGFALGYIEWKGKRPLWKSQTAVTLLCMAAYLFLGFGKIEGWYCLGFAHVLLTFIYFSKRSYVYTVLQIFSVYIALTKITHGLLPLPF